MSLRKPRQAHAPRDYRPAQKINAFGTTVLVTTHDETIVNYLQKRVITMKDGAIISDQKIVGFIS